MDSPSPDGKFTVLFPSPGGRKSLINSRECYLIPPSSGGKFAIFSPSPGGRELEGGGLP